MRPTVSRELLLRLLQATPEQEALIDEILRAGARVARGLERAGLRAEPGGGSARSVFRRTGRVWEVGFHGGRPFHLENTLGARYLDYLLHHPNEPIAAFDLEVAVTPEKGQARAATSIQPPLDGRARREYEQALRELRLERERARQAGDRERLGELDAQLRAVGAALHAGQGTPDTGERARDNVRKALEVVLQKLRKRGREEQALAQHLQDHLSMGYECLYSQRPGGVWE